MVFEKMYLKNLHIRNIGPIEKLDIQLDLRADLNPKPVILVGKNGSGKTYTLSYIADAFYEVAKLEYKDVLNKSVTMNSPYFRVIAGRDISTKATIKSAASYLRFINEQENQEIHYCEKLGQLDLSQELLNLYGNKLNGFQDTNGNDKKILASTENITKLFEGVTVFFPSFRKIIPHWLNLNAQTQEIFSIEQIFAGNLNKEIMCIDTFRKNIQWILDVILDTAVLPIEWKKIQAEQDRQELWDTKLFLNITYENINELFKTILDDRNIFLKSGLRFASESRLSIHNHSGVVVPTLENLSTGQITLLNLFITIIRHADKHNLVSSIRLSEIKGIVVIDEIDTHLHSKHQSDILPKLIKLFPKVQFIVTSHSPLFVLGMENEFGAENIQLIDLPSGMNITSERFGEFEESFNFYKDTAKFEEILHKEIQQTQRPLILVEGETDVKYLKKALELFQKTDWIELLQIDEGGLSEQGGSRNSGQDNLKKGFDFLLTNKNSFKRKVLFLFDCDAKNFNEYKDGHIFKIKVRQNMENKKVLSGVENLLPESLFKSDFYSNEIKKAGDGGRTIIEKLKKQEFCDFVCNSNNKEIFKKYGEIIFPIIEEFLAS